MGRNIVRWVRRNNVMIRKCAMSSNQELSGGGMRERGEDGTGWMIRVGNTDDARRTLLR